MNDTQTTVNIDLHAQLMLVAESLITHHLEEYDGETCFNLYTFIDTLTYEVDSHFCLSHDIGRALGRFSLDAEEVARYMFCCMAIQSDGHADGDTFRGMPILA